jgi:hypothetical protein
VLPVRISQSGPSVLQWMKATVLTALPNS